MYARVARFEGANGEALRENAKRISDDPSGPPEGVPAKKFVMLIDPDAGRSIAIVFFETEEDMRKGDETLRGMSPPDEAGKLTGVEMYEVGVDVGVD
ncbi:MAG TPA: hypothetical protein VF549_12320 [Solirubrobacteraceae bacterium]|jgi:hypothetical protein